MPISTDPERKKVGCEPAVGRKKADMREQSRNIARAKSEALLDEALDETFPASDPVSIIPRKYDSK